jgi:phosphoglycerol transferase MdoB-like AlkP superfamily enzyme
MTLPYAVPDQHQRHRTLIRIFLVLIVLASVVPRLVLLFTASGLPVSDAKWYFDRAVSIVHGNGYAFDGVPTAFWPVGYPGFLALLF